MHGNLQMYVESSYVLLSGFPLQSINQIFRLSRHKPRIWAHVEVSRLCLGLVCPAPGVAPLKGEHPRSAPLLQFTQIKFFFLKFVKTKTAEYFQIIRLTNWNIQNKPSPWWMESPMPGQAGRNSGLLPFISDRPSQDPTRNNIPELRGPDSRVRV